MAHKPQPPPNDPNILVYVQEYGGLRKNSSSSSSSSFYRGVESPHSDSVPSETAESTCSSLSSTDGDYPRPDSIPPPFGWKRLLTNGIVIYVSPSNTALSSIEQVRSYLLTEGTCKCGLECPLDCETTFNFDPKVLTRAWTAPVIGPGELTKLCNHKRKLLSLSSVDSVDNRFDGVRRKKKRILNQGSQPSVSQLLAQRDRERQIKEQTNFSSVPWRDNAQFVRGVYSNGYPHEGSSGFRYQDCGVQYQRIPETRFPHQQSNSFPPPVQFENRLPYSQFRPSTRAEYRPAEAQSLQNSSPSLSVNRTPPWHQNRVQATFDRVPPLHQNPTPVWSQELKKKQSKIVRKRFSEDSQSEARSSSDSPSFMDDPSGYLAQQTALLNSTISRQNANSPIEGVPLASNVKFATRQKPKNFARFPDSSGKKEEPTSTLSDKDERGPIQGGTVSTSDRSEGRPESRNIVTTMASGHTASCNTITSVQAGRANTVTVSVNNQAGAPKTHLDLVQNVVSNIQPEVVKTGHILMSNGQLLVANSMVPPKVSPTSTTVVTPQVLNQPTVLVNTLPGPLLLQPSMMMDGLNTVQIPQLVGNVVQNQVVDEGPLLSPESKRKAALKKRKMSPVGNMVLSPQGSGNVMVQPQQQINTSMLQALTILPSKANFAGTQQLITTNMLQPLNLVQNFPIQQFIVPAGVSGMVMSDGTILQDAVQLNLLTPVQNTVFSNGQNLLAPGMVIRTPSTQNSKVLQSNQFLSSPNQFLVNNTFSGQLSPMLSVSPTQQNARNQDYIQQNVVVQPNTTNTTVVQQNTTIVQQTTMVSNQQNQQQNYILNEKPNFILTSDKQNFILSPNSEKMIQGNFVLGLNDKKNSVSTQTQNQQLLQISSSPALVVATNNAMCHTSTYTGSPPDTTTLSPVDHEVSTSLGPSSPDPPSSSQSLPMVHCVSSSNQQEDSYQIDTYSGTVGKSVAYVESSCMPISSIQDKEITQDEYGKMSLSSTPDTGQESEGLFS